MKRGDSARGSVLRPGSIPHSPQTTTTAQCSPCCCHHLLLPPHLLSPLLLPLLLPPQLLSPLLQPFLLLRLRCFCWKCSKLLFCGCCGFCGCCACPSAAVCLLLLLVQPLSGSTLHSHTPSCCCRCWNEGCWMAALSQRKTLSSFLTRTPLGGHVCSCRSQAGSMGGYGLKVLSK